MPDGPTHIRFDRMLFEDGIIQIQDKRVLDEVHDRMDRDMMQHHGPTKHQEEDPYHDEARLRKWIRDGRDSIWDSLLHGFWGYRDTDFVRVVLGHLMLDKFWKEYKADMNSGKKSPREVMELAFREYKYIGWESAQAHRR